MKDHQVRAGTRIQLYAGLSTGVGEPCLSTAGGHAHWPRAGNRGNARPRLMVYIAKVMVCHGELSGLLDPCDKPGSQATACELIRRVDTAILTLLELTCALSQCADYYR